jgi:hypothetical protein
VDQWLLTGEKLAAATALVEEQLKAGHIEPTHSPWNTPIFVIRKKSGRWRLLLDLRAVNRVMQPMKHSGLAFPQLFHYTIVSASLILKMLFFDIPLHPKDREKFAFTLPSPNHQSLGN